MSFAFDDFDSNAIAHKASQSEEIPGQQRSHPLSVTQINTVVKGVVDDLIPEVWVSGEIADLSRPRSGHVYFTLKDDRSNIRAVMWRNTAEKVRFDLNDGLQVVGLGKVDVYVPRGSYQVVFRQLQPQGEGSLQLVLRQLHQRLESEGLFSADRKRPLPSFPLRIGFVTSPSGAAIRDFLEVLKVRWPIASVLLIPVTVQGDKAAKEIAAGIQKAERLEPKLDLLIIGRGGGSMEDLWCFNEEIVVRAVAACKLPTISAVGHEIDVTLSDLAADFRALTPTDAAGRCSHDIRELKQTLQVSSERANQAIQQRIEQLKQRTMALAERPVLQRPEELFVRKQQQIDELSLRLGRALEQLWMQKQQKLETLATAAEALSPLRVLARGYSITCNAQNGSVIRSVQDIAPEAILETRFADGRIISQMLTSRGRP